MAIVIFYKSSKVTLKLKDYVSFISGSSSINQVIPGNDQNTSPTNQKTDGSKLERAS